MAHDPRKDDETLDALELLRDSSGRPLPRRAPDSPPPTGKTGGEAARPAPKPAKSAPAGAAPAPPRPSAASPPPGAPPASRPAPLPAGSPPMSSGDGPVYRCLRCGYPLAAGRLQCSECGRTYEEGTLDAWFDGVEEHRFEHVLWFVAAALFLKLFIAPPQLLGITRIAAAVVTGWGCFLAGRGKTDSVGGHFGMAGVIAALLMFFALWHDNKLPFYTLDMIAGGLLLLAMLHGPGNERLGSLTIGRPLGLAFLFLAPGTALGCYIAERALAAPVGMWGGPGPGPGPTLFGEYSVFTFLLPYFASAVVWLATLLVLRSVRRRLFLPVEE